ncbi:NAD(P)/FAD-dependent oxidoreductase [Maridesulfovibrio sp.]|uniref:phytoene desaturase family protein n=1 Tax=Maridesulfovibrio sp. TaxID=2795000 RepID=UPI0029CA4BFF|nr:NAD(P)/FAD-dependent oxidoreductase [Maridesulfovibrio sp.]
MNRRFFLQISALAAMNTLVGWNFAKAAQVTRDGMYDAVVVGAGLGGLTCAAYLARHGFKILLLEQYNIPGGYATSFSRYTDSGKFTCEVSLHSSVLKAGATKKILKDLDVWNKLTFVDQPHAWCSNFSDFKLEVPAKCGLNGFHKQLLNLFPDEAKGLAEYFKLWNGVMADCDQLNHGVSRSQRKRFPEMFPFLWEIHDKTVAQIIDARISNQKLKAVLAQSCGYYGLPPSRLSAFYYLLPTGNYLEHGGSYIKGTSQALSDALAESITNAGGEIIYGSRVKEVLIEKNKAVGVKTSDGSVFKSRTVVCNANVPQLYNDLLPKGTLPVKEREKIETYSDSPSSFIVWLGLDRNISLDFKLPEASYYSSYDLDASYRESMRCNFENEGLSIMAYDNLIPGFSPKGCSSVCLVKLCGYDLWKPWEKEYEQSNRPNYLKLKNELTEQLISRAEELAIPGLSKMIVMQESATPLTNRRYTLNASGSIYGFNQSLNNSFMTRISNKTPVSGLFLASAWGNPGGGYGGVLVGGKQAFKNVVEELS